MPRWLSDALRERLRLQRLPYYQIVDGPEPLDQRPQAEPHIVLQSDERGGDTFGPPRGTGAAEARNLMLYTIGMELLIFARGTARSSQTLDHDDQARAIARQLVVALHHVFESRGAPRWRLQPGRFLTRDEIDERKLTQWPGRIYRLGFSWDDTIKDVDYKAAGLDTIDGGDITFETTIETEGAGGNELPGASTGAP